MCRFRNIFLGPEDYEKQNSEDSCGYKHQRHFLAVIATNYLSMIHSVSLINHNWLKVHFRFNSIIEKANHAVK